MKPIKFRGKSIETGEWSFGHFLTSNISDTTWYIVADVLRNKLCRIDPATLCQFTGLTDCNGKEIWEGDIVVFSYPHIDARIKGIVKWDAEWACFALFKPDSKYAFESDWSRIMDRNVIGNRFDNPELMEVLR